MDPDVQFAEANDLILSQDVLGHLLPCLQALELRHVAIGNTRLMMALELHPQDCRRARSFVRWLCTGGKARIIDWDKCLVTCDGGWHPGGVAVAQLNVTESSETSFRFQLEANAKGGDLLFGLTKSCQHLDTEQLSDALDSGYSFIMGRDLAPASIFYGGRSLRCCFSRGTGQGPVIDYGTSSGTAQVEGRLARLLVAGDWVQFEVANGVVSASDMTGQSFQWGSTIKGRDVWQPTVAWTGSKATIRIERTF